MTQVKIKEDVSMADLVSGLDPSFFTTPPSPNSSPVNRTPKRRGHEIDLDLAILTQGAEHWDWTDMEAEFATPTKPRSKTGNPPTAIFPDKDAVPKKRRRNSQSPLTESTNNIRQQEKRQKLCEKFDIDLDMLTQGAEHWHWDDMESEFLTPPKRQKIMYDSDSSAPSSTPELTTPSSPLSPPIKLELMSQCSPWSASAPPGTENTDASSSPITEPSSPSPPQPRWRSCARPLEPFIPTPNEPSAHLLEARGITPSPILPRIKLEPPSNAQNSSLKRTAKGGQAQQRAGTPYLRKDANVDAYGKQAAENAISNMDTSKTRRTTRTTNMKATPEIKTEREMSSSQPRNSQTHIEDFFSQHPSFPYDPMAPVTNELNRMKTFLSQHPAKWQATQSDFKDAMVLQFNQSFGTDINDLGAWQRLCEMIRIKPVPHELEECRRVVYNTHVNLVDLLDCDRAGLPVKVYPTEEDLSHYTRNAGKFFPRENAKAGGLLKYLLRHILDPRKEQHRRGGWCGNQYRP